MSTQPWDNPELDLRIVESEIPGSWDPIPLGPALAGDLATPVPTILRCEALTALLYEAAVNGTHGESGIGKSWLIAFAAAQELKAGSTVLILDYEDTEATLVARLLALGVPGDVIEDRAVYIRPQDSATPAVVDRLCALVVQRQITYVAIDSVGEALAVEGLNEDRDNEVGPWMRELPRRLADAGAAVHLTDHSTKSHENPLHPSGSKRKRAAITGASYLVEVDEPLVKPTGCEPAVGRLRLTCAKDRHGNHPRGQRVATFSLTSRPDGSVMAHLWPVGAANRTSQPEALEAAQEAVRVAKEHGEPLSLNELVSLMVIRKSTTGKRLGIDLAKARGALTETRGPRNSRMFTYACDLDLGAER